MLKDLVEKNRSYRRYFNEYTVSKDTLLELVELARLTPSAMNLQPLKYYLSFEKETNEKIFSTMSFAGYLKPGGIDIPEPERPSAYIVMLGDKRITDFYWVDAGISAQTILLGAVEKGLGGCIVMNIKKDLLREYLKLEKHFEILLVIAIGKPREQVIIEEIRNNDVKYWRDGMTHHVPKRPLREIVLNM